MIVASSDFYKTLQDLWRWLRGPDEKTWPPNYFYKDKSRDGQGTGVEDNMDKYWRRGGLWLRQRAPVMIARTLSFWCLLFPAHAFVPTHLPLSHWAMEWVSELLCNSIYNPDFFSGDPEFFMSLILMCLLTKIPPTIATNAIYLLVAVLWVLNYLAYEFGRDKDKSVSQSVSLMKFYRRDP